MPELKLTDVTIYYQTTGQGEPLVFLHGLGSSGDDWQEQVEAFSQRYQVVTLDLPGHGGSSLLRTPYSIVQFSRDVSAVIDQLGLVNVNLVGLSLGGVVALQLALDNPGVLNSLTLVNSFVELPFRTVKDKLELYKRLVVIRLLGLNKMGGILAKRLFPEHSQAAQRRRFLDNWRRNDQQSYLFAFKSLIGWGVRDELHRVTMPVLVMGAEFDYTSTQEKESYTAALPNAKLVIIENSHHALPVEKPQAFNQALEAFLESNLRE